jgi:hypothetical protein
MSHGNKYRRPERNKYEELRVERNSDMNISKERDREWKEKRRRGRFNEVLR